jgi:hypothetical protein
MRTMKNPVVTAEKRIPSIVSLVWTRSIHHMPQGNMNAEVKLLGVSTAK